MPSTITITFGEQVENHVGMQKIGELAEEGYSLEDLTDIKNNILYDRQWPEKGVEVEIVSLKELSGLGDGVPDAHVLLIRNGVEYLTKRPHNEVHSSLEKLNWDTKAFMYGRVVNKHARRNLCFANNTQEPCYEKGMGRIISFEDPSVKCLKTARSTLQEITGDILFAEGNFYYDVEKCGIGYHGDTERKKVVALRTGYGQPIYFWYYKNGERVGNRIKIDINEGDAYIMSEKAGGSDWKKKNIYTLRHAVGAPKFVE
jgi:hypothetical protein